MYALDTAVMTKRQERQLEVAEVRLTQKDKISNENIRGTLKVDRF